MICITNHSLVYFLSKTFMLLITILAISAIPFLSFTQLLNLNLPLLNSNSANRNDNLLFIEYQSSGTYQIVDFNLKSSKVENQLTINDRPIARLSSDKSVLYLLDTNWDTNLHTLSALETGTLNVNWKLNIPSLRTSFNPRPNDGIWLSQDENFIYLWDTIDDLLPHLFVIDIQKQEIVRDFQIDLPYPATLAYPSYWKLPWSEQLAVLSGDIFFLVDLTNGQPGSFTKLSGFENVGQIPKNLPQDYVRVYGGEVDPQSKTLIWATSAQDIIVMDLSKEPFTTQKVLSLPSGWQFSGLDTLFLESNKQTIHIQVRKSSSENDLSEPDEVWVYNIRAWKQISKINMHSLSEVGMNNISDMSVYPVSKNGIFAIGKDSNGKDFGNLSNLEEQSVFFLLR